MIKDRIELLKLLLGYSVNWLLWVCRLRSIEIYSKSRDKKRIKIEKKYDDLHFSNNYKEIGEFLYSENKIGNAFFVPDSEQNIASMQGMPKIIAFYLPQFHRIPQNDEWHGKGFTEWTNVTKTIPHFTGHYQPHLPFDIGFYDLQNVTVMERQVELAKRYGIYGFCFHYYWFSGTRLLESPLFKWLENKTLNLPFCLCWANENWGRLWDGGNKEILIEQQIVEGDDEKFFNDIVCFLKDPRYIRVQGKPVLIIYRPHLFAKEKIASFLMKISAMAKANNFEGVYWVMALTHDFSGDPRDWGFDAAVEFPPHGFGKMPKKRRSFFVSKSFNGEIYDVQKMIQDRSYMRTYPYKVFKTAFPSWDNTPRKAYSGAAVFQCSPEEYQKWLKDLLVDAFQHPDDERFVFVNAWNEWGEGAHLEPDLKYGYAYLKATRNSLEELGKKQ